MSDSSLSKKGVGIVYFSSECVPTGLQIHYFKKKTVH